MARLIYSAIASLDGYVADEERDGHALGILEAGREIDDNLFVRHDCSFRLVREAHAR